MPVLKLRRNQSSPLSCEDMDSNWEATLNRSLHQGTQLASTISNLYTTVENYEFITALKKCCTDLTIAINDLQDSIFGDGELSVLINNLRTELLLQIAELETDLTALTVRVTTAEATILTINTTLASLSSAITGLQNSKANINSPTFTGIPKAPTPLSNAEGTQIATVDYVNQFGTPIGVVLPYGGSSAPNDNWLLAQGQAISRTTYAGLFSLFGTIYGAGNSSTTFNLPNLQQRVPVGVGSGYGLGGVGGAATHTLSASEMPTHSHTADHTHTINDPSHNHASPLDAEGSLSQGGIARVADVFGKGNGNVENGYHSNATYYNTTGITINSTSGLTTSNQGSSQPHNNMQPYIVLNYIVKVK